MSQRCGNLPYCHHTLIFVHILPPLVTALVKLLLSVSLHTLSIESNNHQTSLVGLEQLSNVWVMLELTISITWIDHWLGAGKLMHTLSPWWSSHSQQWLHHLRSYSRFKLFTIRFILFWSYSSNGDKKVAQCGTSLLWSCLGKEGSNYADGHSFWKR